MTIEEAKKLGEKITAGQATAEEKLLFLKNANQEITNLRNDISDLKASQELKNVRSEM
jgi:hypothetical protein